MTQKNNQADAKNGVVLIVDDSMTNRQILSACLMDDYEIITAKDGEESLELAKTIPDLILLDIEMPGIDGYEVCRRLKENELTCIIPVIFVTARQDGGDEELGLSLGAVDYIIKPIKPSIVVARTKTHVTLKQQADKLREMAIRDQLTNLYNRHYLLEYSERKVAKSNRHDEIFSVLMIDIDHFKSFNDKHGHLYGDKVLQKISNQLRNNIRAEDVVARLGGEEFVIVLDCCRLKDCKAKAESLRSIIEADNFDGNKVTISIGVAQFKNNKETFTDLIERADAALYLAKEKGRNCVVGSNE